MVAEWVGEWVSWLDLEGEGGRVCTYVVVVRSKRHRHRHGVDITKLYTHTHEQTHHVSFPFSRVDAVMSCPFRPVGE